ncbi:hypothetical protein HYX17_01485 [Candidatus Woesearchaeota archaeon]|nr:hypothetical protein [Candidatus Woesearchaeota archaeon]
MIFGWNKLKSWQKGFIIGVIIHIIYFLIFIPWLLNGGGETRVGWLFILTELLPATFILPFMESFLGDSPIGIITTGLVITVTYGLLGSLIGFFIGRYK